MGQREVEGMGRYNSRHFRWVSSELHISWAGSGSQAGSRQQDHKVSGAWDHAHLFPGCCRDSRLVGSSGHRNGAGDRETHRRYHWGQQRNHVLVLEAVRGTAKNNSDNVCPSSTLLYYMNRDWVFKQGPQCMVLHLTIGPHSWQEGKRNKQHVMSETLT